METRTAYIAGAIGVVMAASIGFGLMRGQSDSTEPHITGTYTAAAGAGPDASVPSPWDMRLQRARDLATTVTLDDATIHCDLTNPAAVPARASGDARADFLMTVAEQPLVVFFVPGFEFKTDHGWQQFSDIRVQLADEIHAARDVPDGAAVCLVRWATLDGFGKDITYLTSAIDAVRQLKSDGLVSPQAAHRIVVFGYSAGGNFAADAITRLPERVSEAPIELRLVTLGTPHKGTEVAQNAIDAAYNVAFLRNFAASALHDKQGTAEAGALREAATNFELSRGFKQLRPWDSDVSDLNKRLQNFTQGLHHLNVFSRDDEFVPKGTEAPEAGAVDLNLPGVDHTDLPHAPAGSIWRDILVAAFGPEPLTRQSVQAEITKAIGATAPASASAGPRDNGDQSQREPMTPQQWEPKLLKGAEAYKNL